MSERIFDASIELKDNAMLKHRQELFYQWDFKENDKLGLDIYKMTYGSDKIAWWNCPDCKSPYDMKIHKRASVKQNCPYCRGLRINHTNSMASLRPDLASEWHPILNEELTPHNITLGNDVDVWWLGKCGHEWDMAVIDRSKNEDPYGCPYCSNRRVLKGYNDMWSTNPQLASQLLDTEDGYRYTQWSNAKVDWECPICENTTKDKKISQINRYRPMCPKCSDGIKFPEKFMYNLLKENGIEFVFDETQEWTQGKRYDFYLPDYNWIIEIHGIQHYIQTNRKNARSLEEEQENDNFKAQLAKESIIDNYIIIDARYSTVKHLKNSILNSDIMKIAGEIDFIRIGELATNSLVKEACDLWKLDSYSTQEVAKMMKLSIKTVRNYLKRGTEIGWCNYTTDKRKPIVQLDSNFNFLCSWQSATEAGNVLQIRHISEVCTGKLKSAGGFKWMFKKDYTQYKQDM